MSVLLTSLYLARHGAVDYNGGGAKIASPIKMTNYFFLTVFTYLRHTTTEQQIGYCLMLTSVFISPFFYFNALDALEMVV